MLRFRLFLVLLGLISSDALSLSSSVFTQGESESLFDAIDVGVLTLLWPCCLVILRDWGVCTAEDFLLWDFFLFDFDFDFGFDFLFEFDFDFPLDFDIEFLLDFDFVLPCPRFFFVTVFCCVGVSSTSLTE